MEFVDDGMTWDLNPNLIYDKRAPVLLLVKGSTRVDFVDDGMKLSVHPNWTYDNFKRAPVLLP